MTYTTFGKFLTVSAMFGGLALGSAAQAGEPGGLDAWSQKAGKIVSSKMSYPLIAIRKGEEGSTSFRVTVDREGNILNMDQVERYRGAYLNGAAKRSIAKVDFPDLPAGYDADKLTFSLNLNYALAHTGQEFRQLKRMGRVSSRRIASNAGPVSASIEILEDQAE